MRGEGARVPRHLDYPHGVDVETQVLDTSEVRDHDGVRKLREATNQLRPLTEPLAQRGLTERERANPYKNLHGPSLLDRRRFGAKKSPWENFKANPAGEPAAYVSALDDDNPFNDPIKYWPFKGWAYPPSDYTGPDDARETDDLSKMPSLADEDE